MARRRASQRGSVLMLVPAGVLVLVILGAIAVDAAIAFLAQRELAGMAAAAANDAAAAGLSGPGFYEPGRPTLDVALDPALARRVVDQAVAASPVRGVDGLTVDVRVTASQVCVTVTGHVAYLFTRAVPGAATGTTVTGRGVATTVEGPPGTAAEAGAC